MSCTAATRCGRSLASWTAAAGPSGSNWAGWAAANWASCWRGSLASRRPPRWSGKSWPARKATPSSPRSCWPPASGVPGGSAELPEVLRGLLLARVEALPRATRRLLQVAAVAGRRVDHHLLAEVATQPPERLVELLREAVAHHVLVVDGGSGAYAFRHALVQEAIYDDLLPVQRPPLHAASAHALAARIEGEGGAGAAELGRLAYHWYAAHDLGRALLASVQAGQAAEAAFAPAEAMGHYERALELWEQAPEAAANSPLDRSSLLQRAAQAASRVGEGARAVALINQAPAVPGGRLPGRRAAGRRRAGVRPRPARLGPGRQAPADRQGLPGAPRPGCDHLL